MVKILIYFFIASLGLFITSANAAVTEIDRITVTVSDLAQTEATTWDDLLGRAVLLEFFAYW